MVGINGGKKMTSLEFIEKEIDVTKKQLAKYPLSKEQSDPNYKHKEADIQYIHNKYYTERLQTLQQIKFELEAWEVINNRFEYFEMEEGDVFINKQEIFAQTSHFDNNDLKIIKKVVVMKNDKMS